MAARTRRAVALWTALRQPFVLPVAAAGLHECRWEHLDLDVLGCVLCGQVHACADGRCAETEEVEDGVVCRLSGVVVREKLFVETEFVSHVNLTDFVAPQNVFDEETAGADVRSIVHALLCSETAKTLYLRAIIVHMGRSRGRLRAAAAGGGHLGLACAEVLGGCVEALRLRPFGAARRSALVKPVAKEIARVMKTLVHSFGMPLKDGEVQSVTVGLLYLMRRGVVFEDIAVLPAVAELGALLPAESMLGDFFDIKSRTITESENRVKFALRSATRERLRAAGFGAGAARGLEA
jgi:hypothetical protein